MQTAGLTTTGLGPQQLLALSPGGPGLPPVWVTIGFGLALIAVVLPTRRTWVTGVGWGMAIVGFIAAVVLSRINVTPDGGGQPAAGWPGVALALAALGLLLAVAPAAGWLAGIASNERVISPDVERHCRPRAGRGGPGRVRHLQPGAGDHRAGRRGVGAGAGRPVLGQGRRAGAGRQRDLAAAARLRLRLVHLGPAVPDADPAAERQRA